MDRRKFIGGTATVVTAAAIPIVAPIATSPRKVEIYDFDQGEWLTNQKYHDNADRMWDAIRKYKDVHG